MKLGEFAPISLMIVLALVALSAVPQGTMSVHALPSPAEHRDVLVNGTNWSVSNNTMPVGGTLVLTLVFGFGLIFLAIIERRPIWRVYSGFVWVAVSIVTLLDYGMTWMILGLGIGLMLMLEGATSYAAGGGEKK